MTSSSVQDTPHYRRLLGIARAAGVRVFFLPGGDFQGLSWEGLYMFTPDVGAGIALRDDLEPCWRDWIFGHELGHHFGGTQVSLFSPFMHSVDEAQRRRWGEWRRMDPTEERANTWAVKTLVDADAWDAAERDNPCDLAKVIAQLGLPPPAAVAWERQQRKQAVGTHITIPVKAAEWRTLERSLSGRGGHQDFFRRVVGGKRHSTLTLTFGDFSLARERVLSVKGGWLARYQTLLGCAAPVLAGAGGVRTAFDLDGCKTGVQR